jgi:hypothetical protein
MSVRDTGRRLQNCQKTITSVLAGENLKSRGKEEGKGVEP